VTPLIPIALFILTSPATFAKRFRGQFRVDPEGQREQLLGGRGSPRDDSVGAVPQGGVIGQPFTLAFRINAELTAKPFPLSPVGCPDRPWGAAFSPQCERKSILRDTSLRQAAAGGVSLAG